MPYGRLTRALEQSGIPTGEYTLGDLLGHYELGLEMAIAPEGWASTPVTGAHSIEVDHPAAWLDRDWVMLTTGIHLARSAKDQRQLVAELDAAGVAALGFGLDVVHREIPRPIVAEAEKRDFPVFTVPLRTAFRDVVSTVFRSTLSNELRSSNRLAAMQRFLMDALGEESPRSTVLQRLAGLIETPVAMITERGEVVAGTRDLPGQEVATAIESLSAATRRFEVDGLHGAAFRLDAPFLDETHWLVAVAPAGEALHPLTRAAAQATVPLLAAMVRLEESQRRQETAVRRATLEALLDAEDARDAAVAVARAAAAGIDITAGVQALVAVDPSGETDIAALLTRTAVRSFGGSGPPPLATTREGKLIIVANAPISAQAISEHLLSDDPNLRVGVGRGVTKGLEVQQSAADAELALREAIRRKPPGIVHYEELSFAAVLLNEVPLERLRPKMEAWLAALFDNPLVLEALRAYLRYDLDVGRSARRLCLHPNSVRHRLSRAEEMLGVRLRSPETIVALYVSLMDEEERSASGRR
jgi:purine catabolism regulator